MVGSAAFFLFCVLGAAAWVWRLFSSAAGSHPIPSHRRTLLGSSFVLLFLLSVCKMEVVRWITTRGQSVFVVWEDSKSSPVPTHARRLTRMRASFTTKAR